MPVEVLALAAAVFFGLTHFFSGLLARRASSAAVALVGQVGGASLVLAVAATVWDAPNITGTSVAWGAASGVGTGIGVGFLYRGLARGRMSIVVPLSDVGAVALPVLFGVILLGERPSLLSWVGIATAMPALWLVSRTNTSKQQAAESGTPDGLIAGTGFAAQFIAMARVDLDSGLWPILAARLAAILTIIVMARSMGANLHMPTRLLLPSAVVGSLGTIAIVLYLLSTQQQLVAVAVVLSALYPAIPVILALVVLHERLRRSQVLGLLLAGSAIGLIALG